MHPIQTNYIKLKTLYDHLYDEYCQRTRPLWSGVDDVSALTDEELERICEAEANISAELHLHDAWDRMLEAEKELVAWCHKRVKEIPEYAENEHDIVYLVENYRKFPNIRPKVIDLCLQLSDE